MTTSDELSDFRPANEVLGREGTVLFESFVDALVDQAGIASRHRHAVSQAARPQFAVGPAPEILIAFEGTSCEARWNGTVEDARRIIGDVLPGLVGQVKADRGRLGGRHPWDD